MGECEGLGYPIIDLGAWYGRTTMVTEAERARSGFSFGRVLPGDSRPQMPMSAQSEYSVVTPVSCSSHTHHRVRAP
jgi:hypothetical protein